MRQGSTHKASCGSSSLPRSWSKAASRPRRAPGAAIKARVHIHGGRQEDRKRPAEEEEAKKVEPSHHSATASGHRIARPKDASNMAATCACDLAKRSNTKTQTSSASTFARRIWSQRECQAEGSRHRDASEPEQTLAQDGAADTHDHDSCRLWGRQGFRAGH